MKKINTLNKIKNYSALSGAVLMSSAANANIVYTDIDPDSLSIDGSVMEIDMDNDGSAEFFMFAGAGDFSSGSYGYKWAPIGPMVSYASVAKGSQGSVYAYVGAYSASQNIGSNLDFFFPASLGDRAVLGNAFSYNPASVMFGTAGEFVNEGEKFIGVRFNISDSTHYGWIRVDLHMTSDSTSLVVLDYAYEDVAGDSIMSGEMPVVDGISLNSIESNVYVANDELVINFEEVTNGNLTITSLNGSVVFSEKVNGINYTTSVNNFTSGVYIVNVKTEKGILSKKIFL